MGWFSRQDTLDKQEAVLQEKMDHLHKKYAEIIQKTYSGGSGIMSTSSVPAWGPLGYDYITTTSSSMTPGAWKPVVTGAIGYQFKDGTIVHLYEEHIEVDGVNIPLEVIKNACKAVKETEEQYKQEYEEGRT